MNILIFYYNYKLYIIKKNLFLFVLILITIYVFIIYKYEDVNVKVCICTIGKNENKYVREFVKYYKKLGVDKIFLYDNNDLDGENFDKVIHDYIKNGYVQFNTNYRGMPKIQYTIFNHCYRENKLLYDWFIFYDFDEFIHLTNFTSIKKYLGDNRFKKCNVVYLFNIIHTDNDQIYYENKPLFERFPNFTFNYSRKLGITKIIIRGNLSKINFTNPHVINNKYYCNSFGYKTELKDQELYNEYFYYDHFYFKSTEEYYNKLKRGGVTSGKKIFVPKIFDLYFSVNKLTKKKIDYLENRSGLNLTEY